MADLETWQNVSKGRRGILRMDRNGRPQTELVNPGKTVQLARDERIYYQRNCATESLDIFQNGALVPIKLIDEDDVKEMADNPNLLGKPELQAMFKLPPKKFETEVNKIASIYALEHLVDIAEGSEDIPVRKYNVVVERLTSLKAVKQSESKVNQALERARNSDKVKF